MKTNLGFDINIWVLIKSVPKPLSFPVLPNLGFGFDKGWNFGFDLYLG